MVHFKLFSFLILFDFTACNNKIAQRNEVEIIPSKGILDIINKKQELIKKAMEVSKNGNLFLFQDIEIICEGDQRNRKAADFVITIK